MNRTNCNISKNKMTAAPLVKIICAVFFAVLLFVLAAVSISTDTAEVREAHYSALPPAPQTEEKLPDASASGVLNDVLPIDPYPSSTPIPMAKFIWLEDRTFMQGNPKNFVPLKWGAQKFRVGSTYYHHGVCLTMPGSKSEEIKNPGENDPWTVQYAETYADIPLNGKYFKMTFDLGFDNVFPAHWGAPDKNGNARMMLVNMGTGETLLDTGIINYAFQQKNVSVDITDVVVLRIVYQVSPALGREKHSLNMLLGKALMYGYGDGSATTRRYTPTLDALPTDYTEYEPYASDEVEEFILLGHRMKYTKSNLDSFRSKEEIELIFNGIFALSGKWFSTARMWNYFTSKEWYYPIRADLTVEDKNYYQNYNEDFVLEYMRSKGWR